MTEVGTPPMFQPAWWQANGDLEQQGPGSDASTLRALDGIGPLPAEPRIADLGCGPGRQTVALAQATGATIVALDLMPPFLKKLRTRVAGSSVSGRVHIAQCDMARPPLAHASLDLLWCEGAIYNLGFEAGLAGWRKLLRPGGRVAVTEVSWLHEPEAEASEFWASHYSDMSDVSGNCARAERAGFDVIDTFPLPLSDWDAYYEPIEARALPLRDAHRDDPAALEALAYHAREVGILDRSGGSYSYVFYLLALR